MVNILVAEDQPELLKIVAKYLEKEGFQVFQAKDGEEALEIFYQEKIDLAILDWMMPKVDGLTVCKEIKQQAAIKIIMLTAKSEGEDEFTALSTGADDYIQKPYYPKVLIARVKKLLQLDQTTYFGNIRLDTQHQKVYLNEQDLKLTKLEYELFYYLAQNKGRILSREQLLNKVWGMDYLGDERTVDTHIRRVRDKVGKELIITHRGMGYSLEQQNNE